MKEINNIVNRVVEEFDDEKEKININIQNSLTVEELMAIESIKKIDNPFEMIGVKEVMKDLNICKTIVYRLFQRDDFPSINIGKSNQVMMIAYLLWKMQKRV